MRRQRTPRHSAANRQYIGNNYTLTVIDVDAVRAEINAENEKIRGSGGPAYLLPAGNDRYSVVNKRLSLEESR